MSLNIPLRLLPYTLAELSGVIWVACYAGPVDEVLIELDYRGYPILYTGRIAFKGDKTKLLGEARRPAEISYAGTLTNRYELTIEQEKVLFTVRIDRVIVATLTDTLT